MIRAPEKLVEYAAIACAFLGKVELGRKKHRGADVADDMCEAEHTVPLMTIHKSKGLGYAEFKLR